MDDNQDNNSNNSTDTSDYFESNGDKGRKHHKFRDFDNFNNKNSIRTFLSSILEKNPNFSLKSQSPEKILQIYNCYLSDDNFSLENDFSNNNDQDTSNSQNTKIENSDESSNDENSQDDHFSLKKQKNKLNILIDIKNENQADAREFLFSYFELINLPFLVTRAFSMMVIDRIEDENETQNENENEEDDYDDDDDDDDDDESDSDRDKNNTPVAQSNINSILFDKFLKNTGSLEVFVDHYATIVSPCEGKTYKANKDFIESRILQFKSVTTILTCHPKLISRMSKIMKKFAPSLFSLLKQSDLPTSIEAFRCIVSIYNNKSNIIKKKTRRKWLAKLATFCTPEFPLLTLLTNFIVNQKMIKFDFTNIAYRLIEKSIFNANKKRNLHRTKRNEDDEYLSCSELAPYDDCFDGSCSFVVLSAIETILLKVAQLKNKKAKKLKMFKNTELNKDSEGKVSEQKQAEISDIESEDFSISDIQNSISFLFNVAIEDIIFGKSATEVIINILIAFSSASNIKQTKTDTNNDNGDDDTDISHQSPVLAWCIFLIRKSIVMFSIAERSDNFSLFERRCHCIQDLCCKIWQNKNSISDFVITSLTNIIRASLLCKKKQTKPIKSNQASIQKLAQTIGVNATSNDLTLDDVDVFTKNFLSSMTSELIEDEELTQFVHFSFDEKIDSLLMEG